MRFLAALLACASVTAALPSHHPTSRSAWPNSPLVTDKRWIRDASGVNVTYAGANWPGAADVMIPEGLQYQSVEFLVSKMKSVGMNAIRLTYAIQMIDEIYSNGGKDVTIQKAFVQALGATNGAKVLSQVLAKNPGFTASTTRLEVGLFLAGKET